MSYRLQKIFSQLAFTGRKRYIHCQATRAYLRKLSLSSLLRVSQIEGGENDDEFDEDYIYDYPTYLVNEHTPSEIHHSICEVMQDMEIYSRFYYNLIPSRLTPADWAKLLSLKGVSACTRKREYQRLTLKDKKHELKKKRSEMWKSQKKNECEVTSFGTNDVVPYGMSKNSIFGFRNVFKFMKMGEELFLMKKSIFGPHIIVDCSYESHMSDKELSSCARQLAMLRLANKHAFNPFNIIHCNVHIHGSLFQKLQTLIPELLDPAYVFHYTEKNFLDLFPREKLIYLSPHAVTELETYDHEAVYVIGALVDHCPKDNLSTDKAQLSGIQSMRFPLDKYSNWCKGTKSLMLFQVANILYDLKEGKSWEQTLLENIQPFKTTFSGIYWKEKMNSVDTLSVRHLEYLNFVDHFAAANKK